MATAQIQQPHNASFHQRCLTMVDQIKAQRENRSPSPLPTRTTQNLTPSTKRHVLKEIDSIKTARSQSYVNWPHCTPSQAVMAANGWFYCKVNDRTVCIYCDTICHNWINTDDAYEVHARLAPECPFVLSISPVISSKDTFSTVNENLAEKLQVRHASMSQISRRQESFSHPSWTQTSPSAEDLARAGFFYSGTGNSVTCFYCGGSLHQWGEKDNPTVEHGRWFPDCLYAKHLCGERLHANIQRSKKQLSQEKSSIDKDTLVRLVNARLDLPVVQRLRETYPLSIIKRCIEDQLKINEDDFESENDLTMACFILKKQVDIIQGNPEKVITPSADQTEVNVPEVSTKKLEECLVCFTEERQVACMPCGHLCTCVPCGYSVQKCPMCREPIQSFVRIYC